MSTGSKKISQPSKKCKPPSGVANSDARPRRMVADRRLGARDAAAVHGAHGLEAHAWRAGTVGVVRDGVREEGVQCNGIWRKRWGPLCWSLGAVAVRCSREIKLDFWGSRSPS